MDELFCRGDEPSLPATPLITHGEGICAEPSDTGEAQGTPALLCSRTLPPTSMANPVFNMGVIVGKKTQD